jgi:hypothetical protein
MLYPSAEKNGSAPYSPLLAIIGILHNCKIGSCIQPESKMKGVAILHLDSDCSDSLSYSRESVSEGLNVQNRKKA